MPATLAEAYERIKAGLRAAVRRGGRRTLWAQAASHVISLVVLASLMLLPEARFSREVRRGPGLTEEISE